ncbi:MAG: tetratricopeptide repeat protein [Clostridia bacterium]|nr:tetratricopeptide repeat protein [Clostridia bacterium]
MHNLYESQPRLRPIPRQRVIEKLDWYMGRRDYAGAERHLLYWLEEARLGGDLRGALMLRNELVGYYRKTGQRDRALENGEAALTLLEQLDFGDTISAATTCVNFATALNAFEENERALTLFERARPIYESSAATRPDLLGGLYNNMALTCVALGRFDEAEALYDKAMATMAKAPHGALEQAITCLNMADLVAARDGMEAGEGAIYALADRAVALLDAPSLAHDGYYAFVCEKCAPTLEYYGYFDDARRLKEEAERIYAGA